MNNNIVLRIQRRITLNLALKSIWSAPQSNLLARICDRQIFAVPSLELRYDGWDRDTDNSLAEAGQRVGLTAFWDAKRRKRCGGGGGGGRLTVAATLMMRSYICLILFLTIFLSHTLLVV